MLCGVLDISATTPFLRKYVFTPTPISGKKTRFFFFAFVVQTFPPVVPPPHHPLEIGGGGLNGDKPQRNLPTQFTPMSGKPLPYFYEWNILMIFWRRLLRIFIKLIYFNIAIPIWVGKHFLRLVTHSFSLHNFVHFLTTITILHTNSGMCMFVR